MIPPAFPPVGRKPTQIWANTAAGYMNLLRGLFCSAQMAVIMGIMMVMGLFVPAYSIINRAVAEILTRAAAVGAVFVVLCAAAAMLIMKKRDVR